MQRAGQAPCGSRAYHCLWLRPLVAVGMSRRRSSAAQHRHGAGRHHSVWGVYVWVGGALGPACPSAANLVARTRRLLEQSNGAGVNAACGEEQGASQAGAQAGLAGGTGLAALAATSGVDVTAPGGPPAARGFGDLKLNGPGMSSMQRRRRRLLVQQSDKTCNRTSKSAAGGRASAWGKYLGGEERVRCVWRAVRHVPTCARAGPQRQRGGPRSTHAAQQEHNGAAHLGLCRRGLGRRLLRARE